MKYIYLSTLENRIVCIAKKQDKELALALEEYIVSDNFDIDKIIQDENGNDIRITGAITATEFLTRYNADYVQKRITQYPEVTEQLDMLWHAMDADETKRLEPFYSEIKQIKDSAPKP